MDELLNKFVFSAEMITMDLSFIYSLLAEEAL